MTVKSSKSAEYFLGIGSQKFQPIDEKDVYCPLHFMTGDR